MSFSTNETFSARKSDTYIGAAILLVLAISLGAYVVVEKRMSEKNWMRFESTLTESFGIAPNTPIRLSGIVIGKVESIQLTKRADILMRIQLKKEFRQFYTDQATLTLDTGIGVGNVISFSSIDLNPGKDGNVLNDGASIAFQPPTSITDWVDKLALEDTVNSATKMFESMNEVLVGIQKRQNEFDEILQNTANASAQLAVASTELNQALNNAQGLLSNADTQLSNIGHKLDDGLDDFQTLMEESQVALQSTTELVQSLDKVSREFPIVLDSVNSSLSEIDVLTRQLQSHWILGGTQVTYPHRDKPQRFYPSDPSVYEVESVK